MLHDGHKISVCRSVLEAAGIGGEMTDEEAARRHHGLLDALGTKYFDDFDLLLRAHVSAYVALYEHLGQPGILADREFVATDIGAVVFEYLQERLQSDQGEAVLPHVFQLARDGLHLRLLRLLDAEQ